MSILHVESLENRGDEGLLAKTNAVIVVVDLDAGEVPCWTMVRDLVFFGKLRFDLDRCVGGRLHMCVHHGDAIDVQKEENAIGADIDVRIGL